MGLQPPRCCWSAPRISLEMELGVHRRADVKSRRNSTFRSKAASVSRAARSVSRFPVREGAAQEGTLLLSFDRVAVGLSAGKDVSSGARPLVLSTRGAVRAGWPSGCRCGRRPESQAWESFPWTTDSPGAGMAVRTAGPVLGHCPLGSLGCHGVFTDALEESKDFHLFQR